jgi:probable rRNA maturation factor
VTVSLRNKQKKETIDTGRLRRSLKRLLKELQRENDEVNVIFVDDEQIQSINREYLDRDRPTNVISFAMTEGVGGALHPEILGDIVISAETAARDAATGDLTLMEEMEFLMIHGLLHLIGYNHEKCSQKEVERMQKKERELFFLLRRCQLD